MILAEKYRPKSLDDIILSKEMKPVVQKILDTGKIPSMTLWGHTGTGKSSIINILRNQLDVEYEYINASKKETRGIDVVSEIIVPYCEKVSFNENKIMDLREAEKLTPDAQTALKDVIEEHSDDTSFILTTNNPNKIDKALFGRCKLYKVQPDSKKEVARHIAQICKKESISISKEDIVGLVKKFFPDIRSMIMELDSETVEGKFSLGSSQSFSNHYEKLIDLIKTSKNQKDVIVRYKKVRAIINTLSDNEIDGLFPYLFDNIEHFSNSDIEYIVFNLKISEFMNHNYSMGIDKQINLAALLLSILNFRYDND